MCCFRVDVAKHHAGVDAEAEVDSRVERLLAQPVDVEEPALAAAAHRGEPRPPAELGPALQEYDAVAAQPGAARRLETRDAPAYDDDAGGPSARRELGQPGLADRRVDGAPHRQPAVEAPDAALVEPDARAPAAPFCDVARQLRVGDQRAR